MINLPTAEFSIFSFAFSVGNFMQRFFFFLIGMLFFVTASLKCWLLLTDPFADIKGGFPTAILWLMVVCEFALAFWNFVPRPQDVLKFVDVTTFLILAIIASSRWILGYTSCGCAGSVEVAPWLFVVIDIGVLICFLGFQRSRAGTISGFRKLLIAFTALNQARQGQIVGIIGLLFFLIVCQLGTFATMRVQLFGELELEADAILESQLIAGNLVDRSVTISNRSNHAATIVGVDRSCNCVSFAANGVVLPPNSSSLLAISISPEKLGQFHQRLIVFLDHPNQFRMNIDVFGNVLKGR